MRSVMALKFLIKLDGPGRDHRNIRTRRTMSIQKWAISLVRQGKFKVGVAPADGLGR
jgi:hypothetical protein